MTAIVSKCRYCGKEIEREFKTIREATLNSRIPVYCNEEHKELYNELKKQKAQCDLDFKCVPKKKVKLIPQHRVKFDPTMDICAVCRVSNKDCERVQSDFVIIPEGARFNKNGKISECPNFKL